MIDLTGAGSWFASLDTECIEELGRGLGPVLENIGSYVDAIIKIASGKVEVGKDKDGASIFATFSIEQFQTAATTLANSLCGFVETLAGKIKNIDEDSLEAIEDFGNDIQTIMKVVETFVNMIVKLRTPVGENG